MATEEMFTELPTVSSAQLTDIICAVQGYVSPTNLGVSVQETLQQVYNLFQSNIILYYAGNPNGNVAGSTYQFCWDTTDQELWICTITGTASTAVWTLIAESAAGVVPPARGGTGVVNPTAHTLPVAEGASNFNFLGPLTNGQILIGSTGVDPVPATITAGTNISVTNAAGSITIAAGSGLATTFDADSGSATPIGGVLTISGSTTGLTTAASGANLHLAGILNVAHGGLGISTVPTNGQIPIGNGTDYTAATLTAGSNISISNAAGSITITGTGLAGFTWNVVTTGTTNMMPNNGYITNTAGVATLNLPTTSNVGDEIDIIGKGTGGWVVQCGAGQTIVMGNQSTSTGGFLASVLNTDSFYMICTVANTEWRVASAPQAASLTLT